MKSIVNLADKALFMDVGFGQNERALEERRNTRASIAMFIVSALSIFPFIVFGIIPVWFLFASIPLTLVSLFFVLGNVFGYVSDDNIVKEKILDVLDREAQMLFSGENENSSPNIYSALKDINLNFEFNLDAITSSQVDWIEKKWQKFSDKHSAYALKKESREAYDRLSQLGTGKETRRINHQIQAMKELKEDQFA